MDVPSNPTHTNVRNNSVSVSVFIAAAGCGFHRVTPGPMAFILLLAPILCSIHPSVRTIPFFHRNCNVRITCHCHVTAQSTFSHHRVHRLQQVPFHRLLLSLPAAILLFAYLLPSRVQIKLIQSNGACFSYQIIQVNTTTTTTS